MDLNLFKKIIDEGSALSVKRVHLFLHGESMIHPNIVEMIRYIKTKDMGISMHTNGMLLTKVNVEEILHSGVNSSDYFIFSILGYSKNVHEKIMRGTDHDTVEKNILEFLRLRKEYKINGPIIEVIFYRMPENYDEEPAFVEHWRNIVDHIHPIADISESFAVQNTAHDNKVVRTKTCKLLWERMTIYWNGDVTMCAEDIEGAHILGNLKDSSIKEIWHSKKLQAIKQSHKDEKFAELSLCANCDLT